MGMASLAEITEKDTEKAPELYGKSVLSEIQRERQLRGDPVNR